MAKKTSLNPKNIPSKPLETVKEAKPNSPWMWLGCILLVIAASLHSADKPIGGGDTWVAMASGRYTLGPWAADQPHRTWQMHLLDKFGIHITKRDPFSAKSRLYNPDKPEDIGWVNQNWLTHVLFYKMMTSWGENSIPVYKFIQAALTGLLVFWAGIVLGAHPAFAAASASFGMLLSRSFIDLRPNVSSIFFSALLILLLSYWKNSRHKVLWWIIPMMILWVNVHGGFIYAIMILAITIGGHSVMMFFHSSWPEGFVKSNRQGFSFLITTFVLAVAISAFFSPFGLENLVHPFMITSEKGKIWQEIGEWRSIWDSKGFGNVMPYIFYLSTFLLIFLTWWILFFNKPRIKHKHKKADSFPWPKIDLAQLGIIGITVAMSIKSRRFIYLGGVVLAPYLAQMTQEIINMIYQKRAHRQKKNLHQHLQQIPGQMIKPVTWLSLAAGVVMSTIFVRCMWDIYYQPPLRGDHLGIFRHMVGINSQPVRAIKFFDLNKIKGVVLNEYTNGGFVAFWQQPDIKTGEPLCKLYIDGRAQAAYVAEHYFRRQYLMSALHQPDQDMEVVARVKKLAKSLDISPDDTSFYDKLIQHAKKNQTVLQQLNIFVKGDPQLYAKMLQLALNTIVKKLVLSENDPQLYDKLAKRALKDNNLFSHLARLAAGNPLLFDKLLEYEGLNVALLSLRKKNPTMSLLERSGNWVRVYIDGKDTIFIRRKDTDNIEFLQKPMSKANYPDEFSRKFSIGYNLGFSNNPKLRHKGLKLLMNAKPEHYIVMYFDTIFSVGMRLKALNELNAFFSQQQKEYLTKLEKNKRYNLIENYAALRHINLNLLKLDRIFNKSREVEKYTNEIKQYNSLLRNISIKEKEGWFW